MWLNENCDECIPWHLVPPFLILVRKYESSYYIIANNATDEN